MWHSLSPADFQPLPEFASGRSDTFTDRIWTMINAGNNRLWTYLQRFATPQTTAFEQMILFAEIKKQAQLSYLKLASGQPVGISHPLLAGNKNKWLRHIVNKFLKQTKAVPHDQLQADKPEFLHGLQHCTSLNALYHFLELKPVSTTDVKSAATPSSPSHRLLSRIALIGIVEQLLKRHDIQTAFWLGKSAGFIR